MYGDRIKQFKQRLVIVWELQNLKLTPATIVRWFTNLRYVELAP
jgi:hypothetical protein